MPKYSKKIVERICKLVETDSYTIPEICAKVNISESTYHEWKKTHLEFSEALEASKEKFWDITLAEADKSLVKLVKGYSYEETKTVVVNTGKKNEEGKATPVIKERVTILKTVAPSLAAIVHLQTNRDPKNWKNRQNTEITGKDGKDLIPARVLTKAEAAEYMAKLDNDY